jgi:hypothetical protein
VLAMMRGGYGWAGIDGEAFLLLMTPMARLKFILVYGALIAGTFFVSSYWPIAAHMIIVGLGFVMIAALLGGFFWIVGPPTIARLIEAWGDGYPTVLHASRKNPPRQVPRILSSKGSARDKADGRLLRKRLAPVPGELPDTVWCNIPNSTLRNHYFEPKLYLDRETGQYWVEYGYEAGHSEWTEIAPVRPPV